MGGLPGMDQGRGLAGGGVHGPVVRVCLEDIRVGDEVPLTFQGEKAHLFGPDGTGYHRREA